jgi:drug/metabolite transporter (DMT)-like permease
MGVTLALLAALAYGVGDFVGGLGGRRVQAALMPVAVQVVGVAVSVAAALTFGGHPTSGAWAWGALSGVGSGVGNVCLLRGLAAGRMSVVAPLSAVVTAAIPALVGLLTGDRLEPGGWAGIVLALPAVALASRAEGDAGFGRNDVAYGLGAGLGFALLFVALDRAGGDAGAWPLVPGQAVGLVVVLLAAAPLLARLRRDREPVDRAAVIRWGGAAGALGGTANVLFLIATGKGQLTVTAVLAGLYPAFTVLLAVIVLHERMNRSQRAGLAGAAAAVVLIVTGS